jgi:Bor protein
MIGTIKRAAKLLAALTVVLPLAACYEHTYDAGRGAPNGRVVMKEWRSHWLGGLISPDQKLELAEVCPSGNATIHQEMSFLNGLVGALTSGIYYPSTVTVKCRGGRRADLEFSGEDVERIVSDPAFLEWVQVMAPEDAEEVEAALLALDG